MLFDDFTGFDALGAGFHSFWFAINTGIDNL
jgi:hypothetical protein